MERTIIHQQDSTYAADTVMFEKAAVEFENEIMPAEDLCCSQQIKNLLNTNLRLRKLNELSTMLLF
ncbi:hypothetical protein CHU92_09035 [Flavobacterium cyanobacteriorum]|uniref:Uncharacterized protein n=1 Tax=Flavobacterium cyanobacteriorum TaxID=2022802 RepID=A0A255Z648_9FLAO|nr:hypothetical protein [Flavobacterium cyanobacteriorum]OYQ37007.1 hypothetical protein CHU92_09035 [Flavobacterium cyanobacteriorum]